MDFQFFGAEKTAVVLDIGSRHTRCGFAGESVPRRIFSTTLTSQSGKKTLIPIHSHLLLCNSHESGHSVRQHPRTHTESRTEWLEAVENLLHEIYFLYLQCNPRERRVIICESLLSPAIFRESIAHVLLEKYQVLAVTFVHIPVVSLVPLLKTTALVVDLGFSETRVVPVYAGIGITSAMTSSQVCTSTVLHNLARQIPVPLPLPATQSSTPSPATSLMSDHILEDIYVRLCFMHPKGDTRKIEDVTYPINSMTRVVIPGSVRGAAAAILLNNNTSNSNNNNNNNDQEHDGGDDSNQRDLPSLILEALQKCPATTRKGLSHQVLLVGGGALVPGLQRALAAELNKRLEDNKANPHFQFSELQGMHGHFDFISSAHVCPPDYLGWLGGSIVGTLDQYGQKITKETYTRESKIIPDWMNLKNLSLAS